MNELFLVAEKNRRPDQKHKRERGGKKGRKGNKNRDKWECLSNFRRRPEKGSVDNTKTSKEIGKCALLK